MGLLDGVLKKLLRGAGAAPEQKAADPPWGGRRPDKAQYGKAGAPMPDMDALVSDAEIQAVTGSSPVGEPRRNGPEGSDVDLGRYVIRETNLADGSTFLLGVSNCYSTDAAQLGMDRLAEYEKPLDGVGERALVHVKTHSKNGTSEVGVTALHRNFSVTLLRSGPGVPTDPAPLAELLRTVLTRL
jgi:hypothetical protein